MHISLVSSSIESRHCFDALQSLKGATVQKMATLRDLINKNVMTDLVFFDAKLGKERIFQEVHLYHQNNKQIKWIVIHSNDVYLSLQFIQIGASGILTDPCDKEKLEHSIQSVLEGLIYLDENLIQILAFRQIKKLLHPFEQLTAREFDVFCLLAENHSIQALAEALSITTKTAFNCQTQLRKKLKIKNNSQLIDLANNYSLIIKNIE
ncbi:MAG: response regulator transcription factor [Methylococcales bacterium]|nr:response regulator transcription factor [Methylococcales bacterium]